MKLFNDDVNFIDHIKQMVLDNSKLMDILKIEVTGDSVGRMLINNTQSYLMGYLEGVKNTDSTIPVVEVFIRRKAEEINKAVEKEVSKTYFLKDNTMH